MGTARVEDSRDFYVRYFGAKVTFDCCWYTNIEFGASASLQFIAPQTGQKACNPAWLTCNFSVTDAEFRSLAAADLTIIKPLEDHPWGDRGFAVQDPNGIVLYINSEREPSPDFKQYYRT